MNSRDFSTPMSLDKVHITDSFWNREQELVRKEVIPYQWEALNDRVEGAAPSFCMRNFKVAGRLMREKREKKDFMPPVYSFRGFNALPDPVKGMEEDKFYGFVFQDSDFAKWIEAVGYSLTLHPDSELERIADEAIDVVCAAQAENGYLDTYYIINGMDRIFTNLRDHHELYCFGHLVEGAIAYYQATGKDKLLRAAMRYGDFICECFGPEEGKCKGYPGHEIAEMALARLYEVTGDRKYLELSSFFIDQRGHRPYYFELEEQERARHEGREYQGDPAAPGERFHYHQAHIPVREQQEAVGHAVRAVYLYSGMADVARIKGDEELYQACCRLWDSIVKNKLYITGGIGGTHLGEAFSFPYDLPNDTAYSETCAAIGLVFFARRMLQLSAKSEFADVMELALYNTVLAGMALDGKSFFYVNPLEVQPEACRRDERKFHVKSTRQKWFGCACCPPNIARMVGSLGAYIYTGNATTLFTHLYVGSSVSFLAERFRAKEDRLTRDIQRIEAQLELECDMPWEGRISAKLHTGQPICHTLAFRIPGWTEQSGVRLQLRRSGEAEVKNISLLPEDLMQKGTGKLPGERFAQTELTGEELMQPDMELQADVKDGYLYLTGIWQEGDNIELEFPMPVRAVVSHPRVRENANRVAFLRGPICYCMEEADNGAGLHLLSVEKTALLQPQQIKVVENHQLGHEIRMLELPGSRKMSEDDGSLYQIFTEQRREAVTLRLVPYYVWNNRGEGEMSVWTNYS